jgi:hypothetical protein
LDAVFWRDGSRTKWGGGGGFFEPGQTPQGDTVRALKVSSPLVATSNNSHVHLSLDPGWSPFFCAGKVSFNGTVHSTSGQVSFTVVRTAGGVYSITYATPHPQEHNIVQVCGFGYATVSNHSATGFTAQLRNTALAIADHTFFFSVLA